ncbi:MAG: hypothetical protein JKY98_06585 [Gammaproteobacteria bacterium]|nr:hypothetical protein [Gammaproteobacteria bacterium]
MHRILAFVLIFAPLAGNSQPTDDSPVKFAFYSSAWGGSSEDNLQSGLRLVIENQTDFPVHLRSIEFLSADETAESTLVNIDLTVPAGGFAEQEMPYINLIPINQCAVDTLDESWRLVEISNYTLNPSVRRLIIENTSAFRIYQCVSTVNTHWINGTTAKQHHNIEWVLYHFESTTN